MMIYVRETTRAKEVGTVDYVIDRDRGYVTHQNEDEKNPQASCQRYIDNVCALWGHNPARYVIRHGAKERDAEIKRSR